MLVFKYFDMLDLVLRDDGQSSESAFASIGVTLLPDAAVAGGRAWCASSDFGRSVRGSHAADVTDGAKLSTGGHGWVDPAERQTQGDGN
jgi:hypothetical protein